jgi:glutathione S-transferase
VKLNVLKPSVNNMTARVFLRAANLEFTEDDVWGKTRTPEFLTKNPAHLTPMLEAKELQRRHGGKLRHHAVSLQQA